MCDRSVCVCVILICAIYLSDLEMHLLLHSVLFNSKAVMPRVAIRMTHVGYVEEVCGEVLIIIPERKCVYRELSNSFLFMWRTG